MPMGDLFDRYADLMDEMLALYIDVAKCRDEAVSAAGVYTDCSITQELSEFMTERQNHVLREEDDSYKEDKDNFCS